MLNFIINGDAGKGKASKARIVIEEKLKELNVPCKFYAAGEKGDSREIARKLVEDGADNIIAVGGDGTLHEIINGIPDFSAIKFGIIPAGTGNDFASALNISLKPLEALQVILDGHTQMADYFECDGVRGINAIGTGIDVDVLRRYNKHKKRNRFTYLLSLIRCLISYKPYPVTVIDENGVKHAKKVLVACVCNGTRFGGGLKICPPAIATDGLLDTVIVNDMAKFKFPGALIKLLKGKIHLVPYTDYRRETHAMFEVEMPLQIDGEIYTDLKFDVKVIPNAINLFTPKKAE